MWECPECGEELEDGFDSCWKCANEGVEIDREVSGGLPDVSDVVFVTTDDVPGWRVVETFGVVCGEAIIGTNAFSDMFAGIADILGGRAGAYEANLQTAREIAMAEMGLAAKERRANCVLGIHIDYETIRGTMLMVAATGTAARIETAGSIEMSPEGIQGNG